MLYPYQPSRTAAAMVLDQASLTTLVVMITQLSPAASRHMVAHMATVDTAAAQPPQRPPLVSWPIIRAIRMKLTPYSHLRRCLRDRSYHRNRNLHTHLLRWRRRQRLGPYRRPRWLVRHCYRVCPIQRRKTNDHYRYAPTHCHHSQGHTSKAHRCTIRQARLQRW